MKLSRYIEISESFGKKNHRILFSTKTAKSFLINENVFKSLLHNKLNGIPPHVLDNFKKEKIIIDDNVNELSVYLNECKDFIKTNKSLYEVIQPTADCQLACSYCGQVNRKIILSDFLINKMISRIENKLCNGFYNHLSIGWFGGEPLLAVSPIEKITEKLKQVTQNCNISFSSSITTNGVGLTPSVLKRLINCNIKEIDVTLDGFSETHDAKRPFKKSQKSSYEVIIKNLYKITQCKVFADNSIKLVIRSNVDKGNYKNVIPLIDDLVRNNLRKHIGAFYLAPVHSWGNDAHKNSLENEFFSKFEIEIILYLLKNQFKIGVLPVAPKRQVCMALSKNGEIYDALGNIFNCTEIPYVEAYKGTDYYLGSLLSEQDTKNRTFSNWLSDLENKKFPCCSCKILPICGGACPKAWNEGNPPCPSIKHNLKERLLIFANQTFKN